MKYVRDLLSVFLLKIYFLFIGEEKISRVLGEKIEIRTHIDNKLYDCVCQEVIFKVSAKKLISISKVNRLYKVSMKKVGDTVSTQGAYPMLCHSFFTNTTYPYMLAIKCHHQLYYS